MSSVRVNIDGFNLFTLDCKLPRTVKVGSKVVPTLPALYLQGA